MVIDKEITTTALSPYYKLNTDATIVKEGGWVALGCVVWDSIKDIMGMSSLSIWGSMDPEVAEALAIRWGLKTGYEVGLYEHW